MKSPDFLCIGAQKAGTTWLHRNLIQHPDAAMPHFKELHYYDELEEGICRNLYCRLFDDHWKNGWWRHTIKYSTYEAYKAKEWKNLLWLGWYFFAPRGTFWYRALFPDREGKITGDMTPEYGVLRPEIIREIVADFPDIKIILLLRNPIERDWSNVKMWQKRVNHVSTVADTDLDVLVAQAKYDNSLSNYRMMIENWKGHISEENFLVRFFDEIKESPMDLLTDVYKFLGIKSEFQSGTEKNVFNKGLTDKIPDEVLSVLRVKHEENLRAIEPLFNDRPINYVTKWLQDSY